MTNAAMIRCPGCSAVNRVPREKMQKGLTPMCGRCKAPLPANQPVMVTDATFLAEVERSPLPVLVDMWAVWCGPCHAIAPVLDQLAIEMAGRLRVAKLNVDENPETCNDSAFEVFQRCWYLRTGRRWTALLEYSPSLKSCDAWKSACLASAMSKRSVSGRWRSSRDYFGKIRTARLRDLMEAPEEIRFYLSRGSRGPCLFQRRRFALANPSVRIVQFSGNCEVT